MQDIGESLYSQSEKITLVRTHDSSFELVDDKGERDLFALSGTSDLFALSDSAHNIARLVGQIAGHGVSAYKLTRAEQ
ncbi:hypothetical protein [Massilia sp. CCM 8734]|uniref:hypothetical protein n=1 Tax=Massilia sp. CCM 8734 TaxID=2609283 RepID=UPI001423B503|nr:hypothetical protein [Massilia sp. CCM 8734]NHZ99185.1 hypothetical protein [Massilia sp. CCM 8734]